MKRLLITCGLVILVTTGAAAQPMSASGTAAAIPESLARRKWATPNEIKALSVAISLAEFPMTYAKVRTDVMGNMPFQWLFGVGDGSDFTREYFALTDPSNDQPYYGVVLRAGDERTQIIASAQLYYSDKYDRRYYDQAENMPENLKKDFWGLGSL